MFKAELKDEYILSVLNYGGSLELDDYGFSMLLESDDDVDD